MRIFTTGAIASKSPKPKKFPLWGRTCTTERSRAFKEDRHRVGARPHYSHEDSHRWKKGGRDQQRRGFDLCTWRADAAKRVTLTCVPQRVDALTFNAVLALLSLAPILVNQRFPNDPMSLGMLTPLPV